MTSRTRRALALSAGAAALAVATLAAQASMAATVSKSVTAHSQTGAAAGWRVEHRISSRDYSVILVNLDAVSANDAWVAGILVSGYDSVEPLLEHWDGASWHNVALPDRLTRQFFGQEAFDEVGASSGGNVWMMSAQGRYLRRVNGHWTAGRLPGSKTGRLYVASFKVFGPRDVWVFGGRAIGAVSNGKFAPYAASFDGRRWTPVKVPGKGLLSPVSATSPRTMWGVVGGEASFIIGPVSHGLVERWNGTSWKVVSPQPTQPRRAVLTTILATTGRDVWVGGGVGNSKNGLSEIAWHWNGTAWTRVSPPAATTGRDHFLISFTPAPGGLWGLSFGDVPRIWRYAHGAWSAPVRLRWDLYQLAAVPHSTSVWAIGETADSNTGLIALHGPVPR